MTPMHTALRCLGLLLLCLPVAACALSGKAMEGKVLEEGTNRPIPDAIVVARWQGHLASWAHGKTVCYHVLTTTSDASGRYRFAAWKKDITEDWQKNVRPEHVLIDAYKPGYGLPTTSQKREIVLLKPFTGTRGERVEYLKRVSSASGCPSAGTSEKNLLSLRRALLHEAKQLAETKSDQDVIEGFLFQVEAIELGYEAAERRQVERLRGKK